jgi:hypothetical protein
LFKTFNVTERQHVEFRISGFNFLNHPLESFQGGADTSLTFNYTCSTTPCLYGQGQYVSSSPKPSGKYIINGNQTAAGYASTKYGRRVVEFSAKYTF